ncbi:MAG: phytoene desaturase family protein, partial [Hyphomonadaceae bacterium]
TLMLIAHVEQDGVWIVEGGMQRLAEALAALAERLGVRLRLNAEAEEIELNGGRAAGVRLCSGERIEASTIVCNADPSALAAGIFGERAARAIGGAGGAARSLSAITWAAQAETDGLPLLRHNVFFSDDYAAEFDTLQRGALPGDATIYVCAQDRDESGEAHGSERLLILANAPPCGDTRPLTSSELDACAMNMMTRLRRCGVKVTPQTMTRTAPSDFHALFPATGGALYGRATHGWAASFQRPGARTKLPGLYLAGGGVHPGAGVPMASLSGQLAARRILQDRASTPRFRRAATPGGTSTRSAMTNSTA